MRSGGDQPALRRRLTEVVTPVVESAGFDLEQVKLSRVGRRYSVRVIVDRDGGVGLDEVAQVSHAVSGALDTAEDAGEAVVPGEYVLEVSSPGVDRPLTEPRHWRRNVGRLVTVTGPAGEQLTGRVNDVTDDTVMLETDGAVRALPLAGLGPGKVQVELRSAQEHDGAADGDDDGEEDVR